MKRIFILVCACFLSGCAAPPATEWQALNLYASSAAQPWLEEAFACAEETSLILNLTADAPEISIRLGEPEQLAAPAYQIGTEELVLAASSQSPLESLTVEQARQLFEGRGSLPAQLWVYASGEDLQGLFDQLVMNGRRVASPARLAVGPAHMVESLRADANAVGFLPRRWMAEGLRELLVIPGIPVLVLTSSEPRGAARAWIACLQR